jgi:hypothetical protein
MTVRRMLLAALAAIWAVTAAVPATAAPAGRLHSGRAVTLASRPSGTSILITDLGASRLIRAQDAIDVRAITQTGADDDDVDVDVDSDESKRSGHDRYSAVMPRAPDTAAGSVETSHSTHASSLVLYASIACPQGRAPPSFLF